MNAHQEIIKLSHALAKFAKDNEKISLPLFTIKLSKAQLDYPGDYTIGMMTTVVSKMSNSDKLLISRAEIKDLYEKFYSRNNKFAQVFAEELGKDQDIETIQPVVHNENNTIQDTLDSMVDPVLANALNRAFGGNGKKEYINKLAKQVESVCVDQFKNLGFDVQSSEVICGKDNVLICAVGFETPRGTTSVLVPVECEQHGVKYNPSVFISNAGTQEINKNTVMSYLTSQAGDKLTVQAEEVLQAALLAVGNKQEISDVDLAVIKLNNQQVNNTYMAPQVLGVEVEQVNPNLILNVPQIKDEQFESFAKKFDSKIGLANFTFGANNVKVGSDLIKQELNNFGISDYHIAVLANDDRSITYSVSLNGGSVAFKVPIKIEANKVLPPSVLICNGSVQSLDKNTITNLLRTEGFDRVAAISSSPLYGIKPSELVNVVKAAMIEGNYAKAEDSLNVLSNSEDDKAYEIALNVFTQGLKQDNSLESESTTKCAMIVKSKHSQYDLCGHTGLPLHKVYQDKHGNCRPAFRKNMEESYEGASFMDSKVYL